MPFEYDRAKSAANKAKHGIDFEEAQALWQDGRAIQVPVTAHEEPSVSGDRPDRRKALDGGGHLSG
jgi:uncharacterized DUF497 family protein